MTNKTLLGLRKQINARRPKFIMQDSQKRKEVPDYKWRKPKGLKSKVRHQKWGRPAMPGPGFRGPAEVRGLHSSGLIPVLVHTITQIEQIDAKTQGAIIAKVGGRRKTELLEACKQKKITTLNVKNPDEEISKIKSEVKARQEKRKMITKRKEERTKAKAPEKKEEKKPETKEEERKEMEKVITKGM